MESKGKILLLHSSSDLYGASKILINTALALKNVGYLVDIVLSEFGPLVSELHSLELNVKVIKLGILRRKYFNVSGMINRLQTVYSAQGMLSEIVKKEKYDIVYSNTTAVLVGFLVARKMKIKHVWHVHEIIEKPVLFSRFIGFLLSKSDLVIVVSEEVRRHWEKMVEKGSETINVIYNGLNYSEYLKDVSTLRPELRIDEKKVLVGMIGRVNHWKGQSYFLDIAYNLLKKSNKYHFIMAGDAFPGYEYLYSELEDKRHKLGISSELDFLGFRNDIPNILSGLDIFVLPSTLPDPLPTVVLESMAASKPVVATKHGGALEMVVNEETGVFIPWDDAETAANIIHDLVQSNNWKRYGVHGRERALGEFSLMAFENKLVSALDRLMQS
jgi:glycosyltransferase involved in cell wall biosynthesis